MKILMIIGLVVLMGCEVVPIEKQNACTLTPEQNEWLIECSKYTFVSSCISRANDLFCVLKIDNPPPEGK